MNLFKGLRSRAIMGKDGKLLNSESKKEEIGNEPQSMRSKYQVEITDAIKDSDTPTIKGYWDHHMNKHLKIYDYANIIQGEAGEYQDFAKYQREFVIKGHIIKFEADELSINREWPKFKGEIMWEVSDFFFKQKKEIEIHVYASEIRIPNGSKYVFEGDNVVYHAPDGSTYVLDCKRREENDFELY